MCRDLVSLLTSGDFPVGAKGIYSTCAHSIKLYGIETWPVKEEYEIRLERNDTDDYRIADQDGVGSYKEWKKKLGLVNVEPSCFVVDSLVGQLNACNSFVRDRPTNTSMENIP